MSRQEVQRVRALVGQPFPPQRLLRLSKLFDELEVAMWAEMERPSGRSREDSQPGPGVVIRGYVESHRTIPV